VPGVGDGVTRTLIAELPELGQGDRQQIAALAGIAPMNRDSGRYRGKRKIQSGRVEVRAPLYRACLVAIRHNPALKSFYRRRRDAGKPRPLRPGRCHAQAADHPQRHPARSAALGTCPELSLETMAATPAAASAGSRPQAAASGGATAPAWNRQSLWPKLQPSLRPFTFKTVAPF
jgi:hypothetical protein